MVENRLRGDQHPLARRRADGQVSACHAPTTFHRRYAPPLLKLRRRHAPRRNSTAARAGAGEIMFTSERPDRVNGPNSRRLPLPFGTSRISATVRMMLSWVAAG
jgi:hypothetical protein